MARYASQLQIQQAPTGRIGLPPSVACPNPTPNGAVNPNWKTKTGFLLFEFLLLRASQPQAISETSGSMVFTGAEPLISTDVSLRKTFQA